MRCLFSLFLFSTFYTSFFVAKLSPICFRGLCVCTHLHAFLLTFQYAHQHAFLLPVVCAQIAAVLADQNFSLWSSRRFFFFFFFFLLNRLLTFVCLSVTQLCLFAFSDHQNMQLPTANQSAADTFRGSVSKLLPAEIVLDGIFEKQVRKLQAIKPNITMRREC